MKSKSDFFTLPSLKKNEACSVNRALRGYSPIASENFATLSGEYRPNDLVEKMRIGNPVYFDESVSCDAFRGDKEDISKFHKIRKRHFYKNTYTSYVADFQVNLDLYYFEMEKLAAKICRLFSAALDLPLSFFDGCLSDQSSILR